jgi:hypothetical protein
MLYNLEAVVVWPKPEVLEKTEGGAIFVQRLRISSTLEVVNGRLLRLP